MRAVVIGGSRGIGLAIRNALLEAGHDSIDLSRTSGHDIANRHPAGKIVGYDPDTLVYCAGHVDPKPLLQVEDGEWLHHFEVNVHGAFEAITTFAAQRGGRTGAVVVVASTAGTRPSPCWGAYAASKAALISLAETAAVELAAAGIRVYCIAPGRCATELRRKLAPDEDQSQIMQPAEVARVVMQLLDDHAGVLAGHLIEVKRR